MNSRRGETAILPMVDAEGSIVGKLGNLKRWQSYSHQRNPRYKDAASVMRTATLASRETRSAKRSFSIVPRYSIQRISRSIFSRYFETNQQVCSLPARLEKKQVASLFRIIGISKFGVVRKFEYRGGNGHDGDKFLCCQIVNWREWLVWMTEWKREG